MGTGDSMDLSAIRPPPLGPGLPLVVYLPKDDDRVDCTNRILHCILSNSVSERFFVSRLTLRHCTLHYSEVPTGVIVNLAAIAPCLTTFDLHDVAVDELLLAKMLEGSGALLTFMSLRNVTLQKVNGHAKASLERCLGAAETYARLETLILAGIAVRDAEPRRRRVTPMQVGFLTPLRMPRLATLAVDVHATVPPGGHCSPEGSPEGIVPMPSLRTLVIGKEVDAVWCCLPTWCAGLHGLISASAEVAQCVGAMPHVCVISPMICAVADVLATVQGHVGVLEGTGVEHARIHPEPDALVQGWEGVRPCPQQLHIRNNVLGLDQLRRAINLVDTSGVQEVHLNTGMVDKEEARAMYLTLPQRITQLCLDVHVGQYALDALVADNSLLSSLQIIRLSGVWRKANKIAREIARLSMERLYPRGETRRIEVTIMQEYDYHGTSAREFEVHFKKAHVERGIPTPVMTVVRSEDRSSWNCTVSAA